MSSSEEYLDSLLDSILGGGKADGEEEVASGAEGEGSQTAPVDGGKAMSSQEIEEMLLSMGTLGGEEELQEQGNSDAEDMEAMLAFMNEHSGASASGDGESSLDDFGLEEGMLSDDFTLEETDADAGMTDGLDFGENGADESGMNDFSLDGLDLGESGADESGMNDFSLDGLDLGESGADESAMDDFSLDGLDLGESDGDEGALDELSLDGLDLGGSGADESTLDNFSLDDLALEESESADDEMDGLMSEEDIDRLLSGDLSDGEDGVGDFALEETGESDEDLSALLAGMDHDEDLSEIGDLLAESDHGVSPDDDMLAMLEGVDGGGDSSFDFFENDEAAKEAEGIRELTPEEIAAREGGVEPGKEKKKRKKLFGKKKKKGRNEEAAAEEAGDELELLLAETSEQEPKAEEEGEKKPGVFARFMNFLLEADEDEDPVAAEVLADNDGEMGTVTDENRALLDELDEEDKKGKKKKKKKEKKKKQEEEVDLFAPPEKKLSKKKVITVFMFCGTIAVCIVLLSSFLPVYMEKKDAQMAYDHQDYAQVYDLLYGKDLNEQDEILYQRSNLILQMNRKLSSYENYGSLDMRLESLNALISGVERYQEILPEAETYNVVGEVSGIYGQILERLSADFGVSEQDALEIIVIEDDVTYSQRLEAIINGAVYSEEVPAGRQDVLPEEEEIIERLDGLETETAEEQSADMQEEMNPEGDMLPEEMMGEVQPTDENAGEDTAAEENVGEDNPADENADEGAE